MYLDVAGMSVVADAPDQAATATFAALGDGLDFRTEPFDRETEITGPLACRLWVASSHADADLFVYLRLFDRAGDEVLFEGSADPQMPLTSGWLRASHRELDHRSEPYRPYPAHTSEQPLTPGEPVELAIEIWPTSIVAPEGYTLGLTVLGRDFDHGKRGRGHGILPIATTGVGPFVHTDPDDRPPAVLEDTRITVLSGPEHPSQLLLPIIPGAEEPR